MFQILTKDKWVYLNMHFNQVFNSLFLDSSIYAVRESDSSEFHREKGIYQRTLTQCTIENIRNNLISVKSGNIILDMKFISKIKDNEMAQFSRLLKTLLDNDNVLYLLNVSGWVFEALKQYNLDMKEKYDNDDQVFCLTLPAAKFNENDLLDINKMGELLFEEKLNEEIKKCSEKHEKQSISSRVKLNIYINVKKMMRDYPFFCYCIYNLALKLANGMLDIKDPEKNKDKTFFLHTMNGAVIGSILSQLFCMDILLVDHLGPYNKLYMDDLGKTIDYKKKYLVVCDVVCMGTELSNAKTILDVFGVQYEGCITMVNIVTVGMRNSEITSIYEIDKDNNPVGYKISTDL